MITARLLFRPPALDAREMDVIERISDLRKSLGYAVGDPVRWQGPLRRIAFARAIRASNSIEGHHVTFDDALAAAEGEEPLDAKHEDWMAVTGYRAAMTYVLQLADDPHFSYSVDLIRSLHFMMLQHDLSKNPGRWRPGPIYVNDEQAGRIVYEAPVAEAVPGLMGQLVDGLNANTDGVPNLVHGALAHLNFVMIHPFKDGNGRMARCLQTLTLARTGVLAPQFSSIEEYLGRHTWEYYRVLAEVGGGLWSPENDTRPWIRFCLTAHFQQATTLLRRVREMKRLWDNLELEIRRRSLAERVMYALSDAAMGFRVRNATYRPTAEISNQVATKDLAVLVDQGLLEAVGERKGRYYVASPALRAMREKIREKKTHPDPFDDNAEASSVLPGFDVYGGDEA